MYRLNTYTQDIILSNQYNTGYLLFIKYRPDILNFERYQGAETAN